MGKSPAKKAGANWDEVEIAFILNWSDYCRKNKESYWGTVKEGLLKQARRDGRVRKSVTDKQVYDKIYRICKNVTRFIEDGTTYIVLDNLQKRWITEMNRQRKRLELEPLGFLSSEHQNTEPPHVYNDTNRIQPQHRGDPNAALEQSGQLELTDTLDAEEAAPPLTTSNPKPLQMQDDGHNFNNFQYPDEGFSCGNHHTVDSQLPASRSLQPALDTPRPTIEPLSPLEAPNISCYGQHCTPPDPLIQSSEPTDPHSRSNALLLLSNNLEQEFNAMHDIICWVIQRVVALEGGEPPGLIDRLTRLKGVLGKGPGSVVGTLTADLIAADEAKRRYRNDLIKLVGKRDWIKEMSYPITPPPQTVARGWNSIWCGIKNTFDFPSSLGPPTILSTGYYVARMEDILDGTMSEPKMYDWMRKLASIPYKPYEIRMFLGAFLLRRIFMSPEPMCAGQHSDQIIILYELIESLEGISEVEHIDRITTQLLFKDKAFQEGCTNNRVRELCENFRDAFRLTIPSTQSLKLESITDPSYWLQRALELKQTLMLSPQSYRIHSCTPGTEFDLRWMQAEDVNGHPRPDVECSRKAVKVCAFPALFQQPADALPDSANIRSALVSHKLFFPSNEEKDALDPGNVISKAVVIIE